MASFVLELYRPGLDRAGGLALARSIRRAIDRVDGSAVRYAGSTLALADEVCYVRIDAPDRASAEKLIARLALDGSRLAEVVDLE